MFFLAVQLPVVSYLSNNLHFGCGLKKGQQKLRQNLMGQLVSRTSWSDESRAYDSETKNTAEEGCCWAKVMNYDCLVRNLKHRLWGVLLLMFLEYFSLRNVSAQWLANAKRLSSHIAGRLSEQTGVIRVPPWLLFYWVHDALIVGEGLVNQGLKL